MTETEPDKSQDPPAPTEDPREQETAGEGLPETQPEDFEPVPGSDRGPEFAVEESLQEEVEAAPDTHAPHEQPPSHATGNPHAAGG
jgi:hypothetical protein